MRAKVLRHPQVEALEQWRDESGRSEGWAATLSPGWNWDGCSFVRGDTLRKLAENLENIREGRPF